MKATTTGALVGWKRENSNSGIVITLQVAEAAADFAAKDFARINLAMNGRQLRSLARDLERAADERGIQLRAGKRRWWQIL